jgi:hypothetical protein
MMKFKAKLNAKLRERPEMKEQIEKELRDISDWVSLSPTLRIKKRSDGKSGSESSPSSSSSDSSHKLKGPGFGVSGGVSMPKVDVKLGGGFSGDVSAKGAHGISGPSISGGISGPSVSGGATLSTSTSIGSMFGGEAVLREGTMKKQGGRRNRNNWSSRVFRLFPTCLRYYKDAKAAKPKGVIMLAEATASTSDRKPFSFFVASPVKVINIWPASKEERDEWMVAIKNVVRKPFEGVDLNASLKADMAPPRQEAHNDVKLGLGINISAKAGLSDSSSSSSEGEKK